ncbi:MAG: hypothetical protein RMX96_31070 [Nostoc sp. ChiSLP02]|nr:hypothetical protein [Nostoc sp. DedSLP05]MDZ8102047.1 hypothetical protein [Nostoc sp. DedSLP01]MDZ8189268.1 hypothetical protein [Nostoc sp. ChiSLP02]
MIYSDDEIKTAVLKKYQVDTLRKLKLLYQKNLYKVKSKKRIRNLLDKINTISAEISDEIIQINPNDPVNVEILNLTIVLLNEIRRSLEQVQNDISKIKSVLFWHIGWYLEFFRMKCSDKINTYELLDLLNIKISFLEIRDYSKRDKSLTRITQAIGDISIEFDNINELIQIEMVTGIEDIFLSDSSIIWILPTSTFDGYTFLGILQEATEENLTIDDIFIKKLMVNSRIEDTLNFWQSKNNSSVIRRIPILEEAVKAHLDGKFLLSVSALIPQIEGLLRDTNNIKTTEYNSLDSSTMQSATTSLINKWKTQNKKHNDIDENLLLEKNENLTRLLKKLPQIVGGLYQNYNSESAIKTGLYRHGICHGVQTDFGVATNSLRLILIIDRIIFFMTDDE